MTREKCIVVSRGDGRYKGVRKLKSDRTRELMPHALFSHNPECVLILFMHINRHFTHSRVYFGSSGLELSGGSNRRCTVAISYSEIAGISRQHRTQYMLVILVLGHLAGVR